MRTPAPFSLAAEVPVRDGRALPRDTRIQVKEGFTGAVAKRRAGPGRRAAVKSEVKEGMESGWTATPRQERQEAAPERTSTRPSPGARSREPPTAAAATP